MTRITLALLVALLVAPALLPSASAHSRTERRAYVGGVGVVEVPLVCRGPNTATPLGVCFALQPTDGLVAFRIKEDVDVSFLRVVGAVSFVDATGLPLAPSVAFCGSSPAIPVPAGAVAARVVLGPLPHAEQVLGGCAPGVARAGVVEAAFL